ncbi:hypothetical protein [Streptomyces nigrescens]|uniref:Uncharacterized protein n=1 Tax=Streptomyces nigrescens TaxID=1920 RepID=A0ABY7I885_STRNI|nr:hypothetical protein [Streptomyces libani]WAT94938.1 hypothetical protein STRLI_000610 [Streptomyces libani subsp. libani]
MPDGSISSMSTRVLLIRREVHQEIECQVPEGLREFPREMRPVATEEELQVRQHHR